MRAFRHTILQIGDDRLAAHIVYYLLRGIECAFVFVVFEQVLEDATEHFGVDTDFGIVSVIFVDSKVVAIEEVKQILEVILRKFAIKFINLITSEKSAIEIRNVFASL